MQKHEVYDLAKTLHDGQLRKNGQPYFLAHVEPVYLAVENLIMHYFPKIATSSVIEIAEGGALLHNAIEDNRTTVHDLLHVHNVRRVYVTIAENLTRHINETYYDFINRILTCDTLSIIVKLADIEHNMSDLTEGSLKDKYRFARAFILNKIREIQVKNDEIF